MCSVFALTGHDSLGWQVVKYVCVQGKLPNNIFKFAMSRLASFRGPSTPSASPVQSKQPSSPSSPSRTSESTYHRKIRTLLQELRSITQTWQDLVLLDGLKAATNLVDTRTELEYILFLRFLYFVILLSTQVTISHFFQTRCRIPSS
jgi:hypothetical protein